MNGSEKSIDGTNENTLVWDIEKDVESLKIREKPERFEFSPFGDLSISYSVQIELSLKATRIII